MGFETGISKITEEGGFAVQLTAKTNLARGKIVMISGRNEVGANTAASTYIGVVYEDALAEDPVFIVVKGIADILLPAEGNIEFGNLMYCLAIDPSLGTNASNGDAIGRAIDNAEGAVLCKVRLF